MRRQGRARRVYVTLSREMSIALDVLASKSGLSPTTQAMVCLRQALNATINSDAVQTRVKQDRAFQTRQEWLEDRGDDAYVDGAVEFAAKVENDA